MRTRIIFILALKNLWAHKLRSFLTIGGVTIGISSIIFLVSLGYGLEQLVTNQVVNFNAFSIIDVSSANSKNIKMDQATIDKISALPNIKVVAPVINLAGRLRKQDSASTTEIVIIGAKSEYWDLSSTNVDEGKLPVDKNDIVVNQSVIKLLGVDPNKIIGSNLLLDIIIPAEVRTNIVDGEKSAQNIPLKVVGVINETQSPIVLTTMDLLLAQDVAKFSAFKIKVDNKTDVRQNIKEVRTQLENIGLSTEYVGDTVSQISQVFALFRIILATFGLVALIVASLGTFNTLTISLLERIREVGLFKALGMRNRDIYKIFLAESLIIGVSGGLVGLFMGWGIAQVINLLVGYLARRAGEQSMSIFLTPWFFSLIMAAFSILVGFFTGWYPAKRAVKIDALDALRYE